MPLLEVKELSIAFRQHRGWKGPTVQKVMEGLNVTIDSGEIVAVIGASGSGKSLLAHAIMGILPRNATVSGEIRYKDRSLDERELELRRGKEIAFVPQAVSYLNPLLKVGQAAVLPGEGAAEREERWGLLRKLGLKEEVRELYPHQLSGGMARKVLFAMAAVGGTRLLIADEPTPGMHESDVREALQQFGALAREGCGILLISHDINAALQVADRIVVLYRGAAVETAAASDFAGEGERLRHPYSKALWRSLPQNGFRRLPQRRAAGDAPAADDCGCPFAPWCEMADGRCAERLPELRELRGGTVRCVHAT